jgi:hypothetical protein
LVEGEAQRKHDGQDMDPVQPVRNLPQSKRRPLRDSRLSADPGELLHGETG